MFSKFNAFSPSDEVPQSGEITVPPPAHHTGRAPALAKKGGTKSHKAAHPPANPVIDLPYVDHLYDEVDEEEETKRKNTGGVTCPFPEKLLSLLSVAPAEIIGWLPHGRAFKIRNVRQFTESTMPTHFKHTKITSFQRQLNLYGFKRLTRGPDVGAYYHEYFLRDRPHLCTKMRRQKIKGTGHKPHHDQNMEPNFYTMDPVQPMSAQETAEMERTKREYDAHMSSTAAQPSVSFMMGGESDMPPAPPTLSQRLSDGGARFGRSVSTMLRRVSSLGSEGWNENELAMEDGDDDGDEGLQVDFDQIWKGDDGAEGASSRSSGGRGADFGSAGSQRNQSFGLTTSGDGLGLMQTSDREMDVQLSNP
ncbi:hypothetical protein TeGR_g9607 [Tetraparma gracilis]|uniref:HSF-type DNA-binding domain-containing protein n=1 Tax=Tetraparma gracilis TaxID=2962635 RepID=A0ABQ6MT38_9STRA|nr:hypothetical protein TeGR_g9607 [Tetraparma gracilis]